MSQSPTYEVSQRADEEGGCRPTVVPASDEAATVSERSAPSPAGHTPGPWVVDVSLGREVTSVWSTGGARKGRWICGELNNNGDAENAANARLIAAAPELLEALKALQLQALQSPDLLRTEWGQEALELTSAAIAKALGQSSAEQTEAVGPGMPSTLEAAE